MEDFDFLLEVRCANMLHELSRKIEMEITKETPARLQKSRKQKRVSPNDLPTQYVGRGKGWKADLLGNPFKVGEGFPVEYIELVKVCTEKYNGGYNPKEHATTEWIVNDTESCLNEYDWYLELMQEFNPEKYAQIMELCRGKNLECWCKLGDPCHGDILLRRCKEFFND